MANPASHTNHQSPPDPAPRVSAAVRQRLEQLLERGKACLERGDHAYAHDLLTQCVAEDPGSLVYLQHFRANLAKQHSGTHKKSSRLGALVTSSGRAHVAKLAGKGEWAEAFTAGCHALAKNPADIPTLRELAGACGTLHYTECQLFYLRWALDLDAGDVETNRQAGAALAAAGHFEQAIACWRRVLKEKPSDEEANKAVSRLSVEQTLQKGGYNPDLLRGAGEGPQLTTARVADLASKDSGATSVPAAPAESDGPADPATERARLVAAIDADPQDTSAYVRLARHDADAGRLREAHRTLARALRAAGHDEGIRDLREDVQLRLAVQQAEGAQRLARDGENLDEAKRMMAEANKLELDVYSARAERAPGDARAQYELGVRLKRLGRHKEAIMALQAARDDARRAAETQLHLGECFQHIEQFRLAAGAYDAAVRAASDASQDVRKLALFRAGVLAMGLGELDLAEQRLTELASLDFGYRDVADRLDKIARMRKNT